MKCDATHNNKKLLIVEPDPLLRWSLVTYLSRWFQVIPADSSDQANFILDQYLIDALVVNDDHINHLADHIEHHARQRNAQTRIVRTVMNFPKSTVRNQHCSYIEKPFNLSGLAHLLGVNVDIPSSVNGDSDVR